MSLVNPHDRFFKKMLANPEAARDFLRHYLPRELSDTLELDKVSRVSASFVDPKLNEYFSDLVFVVPRKDGTEAVIYVLFEHKSSPDSDTPLQVLRYVVEIRERFPRKGRKRRLILPVVIYHGRTPWNVPVSFHGFLQLAPDDPFAGYEPNFSYHLCDLSHYSDEELKGGVLLQVMLLTMKHIFQEDLPAQLPRIATLCAQLSVQETGLQYVEVLLSYLCSATDAIRIEQVQEAFEQAMPEEGGRLMPTIAEQLVQEGRLEGLLEGRKEGRVEGMLTGLAGMLEVKFGKEGLQLLPEIEQRADPGLLERLIEAVKHSATPDELRQVYAGS